jgi:CP family cyanate transporter-like MFS transporter
MVFFGIGTGGYTLVLAWLAPFYVNLGWSRSDAGDLLAAVTVIEVVAGIGVSLCINRIVDRRKPLLLVLASLVCGLLCLAIAPERQFVLATGLLGLGIGALFPLSLILTLDHASTPRQAGELSGFVQGGGYLIASLAPLGAGVLRDRIADMSNAWMAMAAAVTCLMLLCIRFNPASYGSVYGCGSTSRNSIAAN